MVKVIFEYDEEVRKWAIRVEGVTQELEAIQAFNAVILSCRQVVSTLDHGVEGNYNILPWTNNED